MYKEHKIRVASDLSKAVQETSRQESKGFNIQTENNFESRNVCQAKLSIKCERL